MRSGNSIDHDEADKRSDSETSNADSESVQTLIVTSDSPAIETATEQTTSGTDQVAPNSSSPGRERPTTFFEVVQCCMNTGCPPPRASDISLARRVYLLALASTGRVKVLSRATISERILHAWALAQRSYKRLDNEDFFAHRRMKKKNGRRARLSFWKCVAELLIACAPRGDREVQQFVRNGPLLHERIRGMIKAVGRRKTKGPFSQNEDKQVYELIESVEFKNADEVTRTRLMEILAGDLNRSLRSVRERIRRITGGGFDSTVSQERPITNQESPPYRTPEYVNVLHMPMPMLQDPHIVGTEGASTNTTRSGTATVDQGDHPTSFHSEQPENPLLFSLPFVLAEDLPHFAAEERVLDPQPGISTETIGHNCTLFEHVTTTSTSQQQFTATESFIEFMELDTETTTNTQPQLSFAETIEHNDMELDDSTTETASETQGLGRRWPRV